MNEPQAYLNGSYVPASQAVISVTDGGFVQGTTVAEQVRTFGGKLFRLQAHVDRLFHSLAIVEVDPGLRHAELCSIAEELAGRNHGLLASGDDLGLSMFVTPGPYSTMATGARHPTVGMHTFPLPFGQWAEKYARGQSLVTTPVAQVPHDAWPPQLKCRSRMHYYLADNMARKIDPNSRALLLDEDGFVTESTTANVVVYQQAAGLIVPPSEKILPGISLAVLLELADRLKIPHSQRNIVPADVASAAEVFLTSTSVCMLPVVQFNGGAIGSGKPSSLFARLLGEWNRVVGLDIAEQGRRFAAR